MADSRYPFRVALRWDEGPESLKRLKTKLLLYFQRKSESNGGECDIPDTNCDQGYVLICFREETVRDRVLQKQNHQMKLPGGKTMKLEIGPADARSSQEPPSLTLTQAAVEAPASPGSQTGTGSELRTRMTAPGISNLLSAEESIVKAAKVPNNPTAPVTWDVPSSSSLVLIENVHDGYSPEMLTLLLENVSGKAEDSDFYVEMIPEIRSAVATFTCDIDISRIIQRFSSNPRVKAYNLTAKPLEEPTSVRVENLPEKMLEEVLAGFLESPKYGGGQVKDIEMLPDERAALITFHHTRVVKRLLKNELTLCKRKLPVFPYYPELGVSLYGKEEPHIDNPEPIEFQVCPYVLEYMLTADTIKSRVEEMMARKYCDILWPDLSCQKPVLKLLFPPSLGTYLRTKAKVVPTWREEVYNEFSLIQAKYTYREYNTNQRSWEAIREHVGGPAYSAMLIRPDFTAEKVFLAGMSEDVAAIDPTFRKLVEETTRKVERSDNSVTEPMPLSPILYQILCHGGLQKTILEKAPELKMDYNGSTREVLLHGLKEEVLTAKCDILSLSQQLRSKPIHVSPFLMEFLMSTDTEELSRVLFVGHNTNAMLEIEDKAAKLTAYSSKDLAAAEQQIRRELVSRQIPVEDESLLRHPEWKRLRSHLTDSLNKDHRTVLILECPPGEDREVVISGLSSGVGRCHQELGDFLEKNTPIVTNIPVRTTAMMQLIRERKGNAWDKIPEVKVVEKPHCLCLSGPRVPVQGAAALIQETLSSLYCDTLRIEKPGAKKFCKNMELMHVTAARTAFSCVISLEESGEHQLLGEAAFQVKHPSGLTVSVYKEDLCHHNVDVIVNAANKDLRHVGGLAKAILDAAGRKLQEDCNHIIRKKGPLPTGEAAITDAGTLPCKQVIHTVGPQWDLTAGPKCEQLLRRAITSSLQLASQKSHSSIAIPAVSSGVYGFPLKLCVENIVEAIRAYVDSEGHATTLQQIHLVDTKDETVRLFSEATKAKFADRTNTSPSRPAESQHRGQAAHTERPPVPRGGGNGDCATTKEGLVIRLIQKNIEDCTTDVVVNSVGDNLDLSHGAISKALLSRAGPSMQQLLHDVSLDTQAAAGSVYKTSGCSLSCQEVLHVVTPQWDSGQGTSEKILRGIITRCLALTEQNQQKSISFPAIGTGILGFPKTLVASVMLDEIHQFSRNGVQNVQEVHLVVHPSDRETIKAFSGQLASCTGAISAGATERQPANTGSTFFGTVTNPSLGVHEMKVGPITYQVMTGDITKEMADVIVNSSNDNFTLRTGVSKAILEAAGGSVAAAAATLGSQSHKGYAMTQAGNIQSCNWILHVTGPKDPASIKKIVLNILQECERHQAASVAIPALGTGAGRVPAATIADAILDGVVEFVKSKSANSVQMVKVVIFQQQMLNDFYTSMKQHEGTTLPQNKPWYTKLGEFFMPSKAAKPLQKLSAFQLTDNIEPVVISLCAETKDSVDKTKAWLQQQIEYEQAERTLTEECISELEEAEMKKISDLQKQFQVSVSYNPADPSIRIRGLTRDVLTVTGEIEKIINRIKDKKHREQEAELTGRLVEWRFSHQGNMVPFDKLANLQLEEAKKADLPRVTIQSQGSQIVVSLGTKTATDSHGNRIQIQRVDKQSMNSLPTHWEPMGANLVLEVDVFQGTPEYTDVEQKFRQSCRQTILKVLRVQNADLWQQYQIRKKNIDTKNGSTNNEMELFHGTDSNSIQHVNHNGFNRSYAGRHAAAYGNGTYFAINASYSASRSYAKPDANGEQHMYLASVLTGVSCAGHHGMVMPPAKDPRNPTDLYDSATDNVLRPTMFVIFHDVQAYPTYHIIFQ